MAADTRRNGREIGVAERPRSIARIWVAFAPKVLALAFLGTLAFATFGRAGRETSNDKNH